MFACLLRYVLRANNACWRGLTPGWLDYNIIITHSVQHDVPQRPGALPHTIQRTRAHHILLALSYYIYIPVGTCIPSVLHYQADYITVYLAYYIGDYNIVIVLYPAAAHAELIILPGLAWPGLYLYRA